MVGDVTSVGAVSAANGLLKAEPTAGQKASLDYDAFLKLLIAQMQNQDPMNPADSSDYIAQLATFSQVEQSIQSNDRLSDLLISSLVSQAGSIVGHTIQSADGEIAGRVVSARIENGGVVATLADGQELLVQSGIVVGAQGQ